MITALPILMRIKQVLYLDYLAKNNNNKLSKYDRPENIMYNE
jgi:hypothetical protein